MTKAHAAAEKGSITRGFDAFDAFYLFAAIVLVLALLALAGIVWVTLHQHKMRRLQAQTVPYAYARDTETQTVNLRK